MDAMRFWSCLTVVLTFLVWTAELGLIDGASTIRTLSTGQIRGRHVITDHDVGGYQFLGIPYAEPPVGPLRYQKAVAARKWKGVIDTTEYRDSCLWNSSETSNDPNKTPMSEDCLFMNVLTNKHCLSVGGCPVIFYIHGGGFRYDSPSLFSPKFLIDNFLTNDRSVVIVMPGYRIGSFGFLNIAPTLATSSIKNIALFDLIEGLNWVQREITNFGGDSANVAIMGHSSGAATVNFLSISPLARGLFAKAIVMSGGGGATPLPYDKNRMASVHLAKAAHCADSTTNFDDLVTVEKVLHCLRAVNGKRLILLQRQVEDEGYSFMGPCVDGRGGALPESIERLRSLRDGIPLMIGTTEEEFSDTDYLVRKDGTIDEPRLWEVCMQAVSIMAFKNKIRTTADCFMEYLNPSRTPHIFDDVTVFVPTLMTSADNSKAGGTTYLYEFQYRFVFDAFVFNRSLNLNDKPSHTEDLVYVMGIHKGNFSEKDVIIAKKYSKLFVNFAKSSNPNIEGETKWTPFNTDVDNYFAVDFDDDNMMPGMRKYYHQEAMRLWNGTALRHSGGAINPVSEKETLRFEVDTHGKNPSLREGLMVPNGDILNDLAQISMGNMQVLQESLPDVLADPSTTYMPPQPINPSSEGEWNLYFWIAVSVIILFAATLLVTCVLFCYNRHKRLEYERLI